MKFYDQKSIGSIIKTKRLQYYKLDYRVSQIRRHLCLYINRKAKTKGGKRKSATSLGSVYGGLISLFTYAILFSFFYSMAKRMISGSDDKIQSHL